MRSTFTVIVVGTVLAACSTSKSDRATPDTVATTRPDSSSSRPLASPAGFSQPEAVRYDPDQDVYFVSNMKGAGSAKDDNGYISRIRASDPDSASVFSTPAASSPRSSVSARYETPNA